jgi:antitoxin component of MazEF toxin-antitoxin module
MKGKCITFGKRKITRQNYSNCVTLPKTLLENMSVTAGDYIEFIADSDLNVRLKPVKAKNGRVNQQETSQKADAEEKV